MATQEKNARELALLEERKLFEQEMAGVRPIRSGGPEVIFERNPPPHSQARNESRAPVSIEEKDGRVQARGPGVSEATLRALAKGEFSVAATCDLHGYREETARRRVQGFLGESQTLGRHVVLVICGRGLHSDSEIPVVRQATLEILGKGIRDGRVLAVVSAPSALGGAGALVVMLRRKRMG